MNPRDALPEVFSLREVARAAGVSAAEVRRLVESGEAREIATGFLNSRDAAAVVRRLSAHPGASERTLFRMTPGIGRRTGLPLAASGTLHVLAALIVAFVTAVGFARPEAQVSESDRQEMRLIFLVAPGPGGGGGGGGKLEPTPPPAARRKGTSAMRSPLPARKPPPEVDPPPVVRASDPPPVKAEPLPPIVAPVVVAASNPKDLPGIPVEAPREAPSHGPGAKGGTGSGQGTGVGEGTGSGIGPGSGGGTGGGPYRPGSGITPPSVLREVKPDYTDEGRRRGLEGDVVLEIVVRRDGSVSDVKVVQGLGGGLDQRAVDAVRQWRFSPAKRLGVPVDVIVEVAVEFKLR